MRLLSAIALLLVQTLLFGQTQNNPIHSNLDQIGLEGVAKQNRRGSDVVRVFILAGQSNMQGQGKIYEGSNGAIGAVVSTFTPVCEDLEATSCDFTLNMVDGYGDGWNGWTYDFVQNGIALATETLENGTEGTATINLLNGVECEVIVNNAGAYGDELSWTLTNVDDAVIASLNGQQENYPSPNTLVDVMENDEDGIWPMLQIGEEEWMELDNAYIYFENGDGTLIRDKVTVGQGAYPHMIGPELMFAYQMDQYFDDPVLIIKTAWGGLSLAEDFRPPSAGGTTGPYYTEMINRVDAVTQNLTTEFPNLGIAAYEISGFAWFQGWNDGGEETFLDEYESNLTHLLADVRDHFENPSLPFVVASSGQGGYEEHWGWMENIQDIVAVAQENVACDDEQYGGTVGFVDTKPLYMSVEESPDDAGFHFHNNALTFLNVGKSIGDEMILALNDMAFCAGFTSVPQELTDADVLRVYPNPAKTQINIKLNKDIKASVHIELFNSVGQCVMHRQMVSSQPIDVSHLERGVYFIKVKSKEGSILKRVILT